MRTILIDTQIQTDYIENHSYLKRRFAMQNLLTNVSIVALVLWGAMALVL
jgi:hypothetical protein